MGKPSMVGYQLTHAEVTELIEHAAARGASCPTEEYLADHARNDFLAVPVCHTTDEDMLVALTAIDPQTMRAVPEPEELPDDLTVEDFFAVIDGSRRTQHLRRRQIAAVFLEVAPRFQAGLGERKLLLPLRVGRWFQREGLLYLARVVGPGPVADTLEAEAAKLG